MRMRVWVLVLLKEYYCEYSSWTYGFVLVICQSVYFSNCYQDSTLTLALGNRYGPPGTGKTLLAKAVATESEANFMAVSIPDLIKGEVGESEKAIAKVFKMATRCSPCIVFLDELEAIFGTRESSGSLGKQVINSCCVCMCADPLDIAPRS